MKPPLSPVLPRTDPVQSTADQPQAPDPTPNFHADGGNCSAVSDMLQRIGDKWTVLVVSYLGNGPMRFNEMRRTIGNISQKMLTTTLRNLERDGMISRTVTPTRPPSVEYALTELGRCLLVPVSGLATWTLENRHKIEAARAAYDMRQDGAG